MSDDIVMRLRAGFLAWRVSLLPEAADEIERLRSALDTAIRERNEARAEVERQARHIEELREKIDAEGSCACSLDAPGDICAAHSPALMRARAEVERLRAALNSIARNTCCGGCQEAARVAREAMEVKP